jgi:hypothetical protein
MALIQLSRRCGFVLYGVVYMQVYDFVKSKEPEYRRNQYRSQIIKQQLHTTFQTFIPPADDFI